MIAIVKAGAPVKQHEMTLTAQELRLITLRRQMPEEKQNLLSDLAVAYSQGASRPAPTMKSKPVRGKAPTLRLVAG